MFLLVYCNVILLIWTTTLLREGMEGAVGKEANSGLRT